MSDVQGYLTHSAIIPKNDIGCAGLLLMPHQVGHYAPPCHVFCSVCSPKGRLSPAHANTPNRPRPIPVDGEAFAEVEARAGGPAPAPSEAVVSVRQLGPAARRALYALHTRAAGAAKFLTKAALLRLRAAELVDVADPKAAKLTERGADVAEAAHWGEELGGQVQVPMFDAAAMEVRPREQEPEPSAPAEVAPASPAVEARSPWRWVGGKGSLLPSIIAAMPEKFGRLLVPFVGGGALVFAMPERAAYISDANTHLINAYTCMRDRVDDLILALQDHKNDRDYYDAVVESFNDGYGDEVWRAAAFMYMNKVGFNGVCRYNRHGGYNVPFGDNPRATICDADNLRACSAALRNVEIVAEDFRAVEERAQPGDLCYFDPPYLPESKTASFTGYWGKWGDAEHEAVAALFRRLASRGVHVLASNSDTPKARELYAGFEIRTLIRANSVNSKASARGGKTEILVLGGTWMPRGEP